MVTLRKEEFAWSDPSEGVLEERGIALFHGELAGG
jgi:hypothetical protein